MGLAAAARNGAGAEGESGAATLALGSGAAAREAAAVCSGEVAGGAAEAGAAGSSGVPATGALADGPAAAGLGFGFVGVPGGVKGELTDAADAETGCGAGGDCAGSGGKSAAGTSVTRSGRVRSAVDQ